MFARLAVVRSAFAGVVTVALAVVIAASAQAVVPTAPAQTWGVNGRVSAILPLPSGRVVVGGSFTAVVDSAGATQFTASNLALFDPATGQFDSAWRPSVNGSVNALATDGARLYLGGAFSKVGGVNRDKLAAVTLSSGALEPGWVGPKLDGPVDVMRLSAGALFVGGNWNTVTSGTTTYAQAKVAKVSASTGAFDTAFRPTANPTASDVPPSGRVWALLVLNNGNVVLGGDFGDINGVASTRRIAVVDPATGTRFEASCPSPTTAPARQPSWTSPPTAPPSTRPSRAAGAPAPRSTQPPVPSDGRGTPTGTCSRSGSSATPSTAAGTSAEPPRSATRRATRSPPSTRGREPSCRGPPSSTVPSGCGPWGPTPLGSTSAVTSPRPAAWRSSTSPCGSTPRRHPSRAPPCSAGPRATASCT